MTRRPSKLGALVATLLVLLACACDDAAPPSTSVLVRIDADPAVRASAPKLRITVYGGADFDVASQTTVFSETLTMDGVAHRYPVDLALAPSHGDTRRVFRVVATALSGADEELAVARLQSGYVEGRSRSASMRLEASCLGVVCADVATTCQAGACGDANVDPSALEEPPAGGLARRCAVDHGGCDPSVTCTDVGPDEVTCGDCPSGFTGSGAVACVDLDECASNPCDPLTTCTNTEGSFTCGACPHGTFGTGETGCKSVLAGCAVGVDPEGDTSTQTFAIRTLQVPGNSNLGANLDGVASTGAATDAAGCFTADGTDGVDDSFAMLSQYLANFGFMYSPAFQAVVNGSVTMSLEIASWNRTGDDGCIRLSVVADTGTGPQLLGQQATSLVDGVTPFVDLGASVTLPLLMTPSVSCTPGTYPAAGSGAAPACANQSYTCDPTLVPITLRDMRVRAHVSQVGLVWKLVTNTPLTSGSPTVTSPSMLAGYVRYWETSGGTRPTCDDQILAGDDFQATLQRLACEHGRGATWGGLCNLTSPSLDLHDASGTLTACTSGGTATTSDANAFSAGFFLGLN